MSRRGPGPDVDGIVLVDKPEGPTSHDVVSWMRRAFGQRSVGHAGTLDPMATGLLVLALGQGTKLVRWFTEASKEYECEVVLGIGTDSHDAEGTVCERAPVGNLAQERVQTALAAFAGMHEQQVPAYSAVKVEGQRLYARARRGEQPILPMRNVVLHRSELLQLREDRLVLRLEVSKGFYVRAFARDLSRELSTCGHLSALRRVRSGWFEIASSVPGETVQLAASGDEHARATLRRAVMKLEDTCQQMPAVRLTSPGEAAVRHGRPVPAAMVRSTTREAETAEAAALLSGAGTLLAIGRWSGAAWKVLRGFNPSE